MSIQRPILISVVQYLPQLESGTLSILDLIDRASQFGVDGVELRREAWPAYKTELPAVRKRLEASGLLVTYATFSTLFAKDEAAHQLLLEDIDTAHALGAPLLRIFPGATPADGNEASWAKARQVVDHAAYRGIQIALENFSGSPGGTLAEVAHILEQIDSPTLKTNIDIGNYPLHQEDVLAVIETIGNKAIYVHVKDYGGSSTASRVELGEGIMPLAQIFAAIDRLPQRILLCFEFSGGDDPDGRIERALSLMRRLRDQQMPTRQR
jgi:sugar phosphate isomerase/epimerase